MSERPLFRVHASVAIIDRNRILLVQEAKPETRGKWNLPGGHVDHGEAIPVAAARETREETHLDLPLSGLIGIYRGKISVRFVFRADYTTGHPQAGDEILDVKWFELDSINNHRDEELEAPQMLRKIIADLQNKASYPLSLFAD